LISTHEINLLNRGLSADLPCVAVGYVLIKIKVKYGVVIFEGFAYTLVRSQSFYLNLVFHKQYYIEIFLKNYIKKINVFPSSRGLRCLAKC